MEEGLKPKGFVRYFQRDDKTGLIVPGTYVEDTNTVNSGLTKYLAYVVTTVPGAPQDLDSKFGTGRAYTATAYPTGDIGGDGIALLEGGEVPAITLVLATSLNDGGDGSSDYVEYLGSIPGSVTLDGTLQLGWNLIGTTGFTAVYASYSINVDVLAGRTFYFYWKITMS